MIEVMGETMSDPVIDILLDPLDWLLFTSTNYFFCPPIVPMCICYFELWVCVVIGEIIIDKIFALIHKFGTPKVPDGRLVDDYWRLTSILHSSNNGYGSPQFYPVVMCDASCIDDPFQPQHVSIVHVVEIRRRNMFWNTVIVWRVSLLDGRQKKVHQFNHFSCFIDGKPFSRTRTSRVPSSCQSDGVMLIEFRDRLHVWDTRLDVSKSDDKLYQISGIQCVDRIRNSKGDLEGWRIRIISCNIELGLVEGGDMGDPGAFRFAPVVGWQILEFGNEARVIRSESDRFGYYLPQENFTLNRIRTIEMFGMMVENTDTGRTRTMLCDKSGKFTFFESFDALRRFDRNFAVYIYTPFPSGIKLLQRIVINNQECVVSTRTDEIFRSEFNASSMKYTAANALFRSMPNFSQRMNADQFRCLTGIREMEKHIW